MLLLARVRSSTRIFKSSVRCLSSYCPGSDSPTSFSCPNPSSFPCRDDMPGFEEIREGSASMLYDTKEVVFYNKVQVFNRDISIQTINLFASIREKEAQKRGVPFEGIKILDALAATGLRSVRYLKEISNVKSVTINDILPEATAAAQQNCVRNEVDMSKVQINTGDATMFMYQYRAPNQQFDVIDLDPYGSASPFLDSAVQAIADGGLMCVTCTDMTVLGGVYPEVCYSKYGCVSVKGDYVHELSLRILLHAIDSAANRYRRYIVPWMCLSVDFYVRVFVRVYESPNEVKKAFLKRGFVLQSTKCPSYYLRPLGQCQPGKQHSEASKLKKKHGKPNPKAAETAAEGAADAAAEVVEEAKPEEVKEEEANAEAAVVKPKLNTKTFWGANNPLNRCVDNSKENSTPPFSSGMNFSAPVWTAPSICEETDSNLKLGGPFWMQVLHNQEIVDELLRRARSYGESSEESAAPAVSTPECVRPTPSTLRRILAVLAAISEEIKDIPLYYYLPNLHSQLRIPENLTMPEICAALTSLGYRVSQFHREPLALKTDAPNDIIWDILRTQAKKQPPKMNANKKFTESTLKMLARPIQTVVDLDNLTIQSKPRVAKYLDNPEKDWGPKRKAGRQQKEDKDAEEGQGQEAVAHHADAAGDAKRSKLDS